MPADLFWERYYVASAFAFGLLLGSFANVLAWRVPRRISIVTPGSFCTHCGRSIRWYDNVPLLSFLFLGGRCRDCRVPISWRYPAVELVTGILTAAIVVRFGASPEAGAFVLLGLLLVALFLTDYDFQTLPDELTVFGIVLGLGAGGLGHLGWLPRTRGALDFPQAALGAVAGAGLLLLIMFLYQAIRDRRGMGVGDVKLLAAIGAFMGLELTLVTLLVAVILGAAGGILFVAVKGGGLSTALPFGTYLAVSTVAVLLFWQL